jgi:hypothetical protein
MFVEQTHMATTLSFISWQQLHQKITSCTFQAHPTQMTRPCDARGVTFLSETSLIRDKKVGAPKGFVPPLWHNLNQIARTKWRVKKNLHCKL